MQYLEQRSKWERVNTGNYVYLSADKEMLLKYIIINNNKLYRYILEGNPKEVKYLLDPSKKTPSTTFQMYMRKKQYRIGTKFDMIKKVLIKKLFDKWPWNDNNYNRYTYTIAYDSEYGYPKMLGIDKKNNENTIILGVSYPYSEFIVDKLIVLPKNTKFTEQNMEDMIMRYKPLKNDVFFQDLKVINKKGGNLIKSGIFKSVNTSVVLDRNESK